MWWRYGEANEERRSEVEEQAALSIYMYEPNRKALRGLPAIVSTVYQMTFHTGQSFKETSPSPNKTE